MDMEVLLCFIVGYILCGKGCMAQDCFWLNWTSPDDNIYRSHCYFYIEQSSRNMFDASTLCTSNDSFPAPYIDSYQLSNLTNYIDNISVTQLVWIGLNEIRSERTYENWNCEPTNVLDIKGSGSWRTGQPNNKNGQSYEDQDCVVIENQGLSDKVCDLTSEVSGILCYKNMTDPVSTSSFSQEDMKNLIGNMTISKTETTAFRNKFICLEDNRPSAVGTGVVGCVIIILVPAFVIVSDAITFCKKSNLQKSNTKQRSTNAITPDNNDIVEENLEN